MLKRRNGAKQRRLLKESTYFVTESNYIIKPPNVMIIFIAVRVMDQTQSQLQQDSGAFWVVDTMLRDEICC